MTELNELRKWLDDICGEFPTAGENISIPIRKIKEKITEIEVKVFSSNAMLKVTSDSTENKKESEVAVCEIDKHDFEGVNNGFIMRCKKCGLETI